MTPPKLMLTIVAGGVALGALGGQLARPVMKSAGKPDWHARFESQFSATPAQLAEGGPEDLSPQGWFGPGDTPPVSYAPPPAEQYAVVDAPEPQPEVEQASADATETAAVLAEPSPAEATSQAPQTGQSTSADKAL
ncbi:MAG: hypothetical protein JWQ16_109 [Novosphingobium sp.]|nr:hypothetical protein [Novosphingobium sp.]